MDNRTTADVLSEFLSAPSTQGLSKEAESKIAASIMDAFVTANAAVYGTTKENALAALQKFAENDPTGYQTYFNNWYQDFMGEIAAEQEKYARAQAAEAADMAKVAESEYLGRVMAHAFTAELGEIFDAYQQKLAQEEGKEPEKEEGKAQEQKAQQQQEKAQEGEKKEEEKPSGVPPALAEYMAKEKEKKTEEAEKEAQKIAERYRQLPAHAQIRHRSIVKKANAGYQLTDDDLEFLSNLDLHLQGLPVQWVQG